MTTRMTERCPNCPTCGTEYPRDALDCNSGPCITCSHVTRCPNFAVCGNECPHWVFNCHDGLCMNCNMLLGPLTFFENSSANDPCPICLETTPLMVQMTCEGQHNICVACFRKPLETREQPQPQEFGCPYASEEDEDDVIEDWSKTHPTQYGLWNDAIDSLCHEDEKQSVESKQALTRCSICRGGSPWDGGNTTWVCRVIPPET